MSAMSSIGNASWRNWGESREARGLFAESELGGGLIQDRLPFFSREATNAAGGVRSRVMMDLSMRGCARGR